MIINWTCFRCLKPHTAVQLRRAPCGLLLCDDPDDDTSCYREHDDDGCADALADWAEARAAFIAEEARAEKSG